MALLGVLRALVWSAIPGSALAIGLPPAASPAAPSPTVTATLTRWRLPAPVHRTVAVASGGRVFVLGGLDSAGATTTTVDSFDPKTGRTGVAGSLALPTHGSAAAVVHGQVLVFGGASLSVHDTVQLFRPTTRHSVVVADLPGARADTTAATTGGVTVLVGGFDGAGPQSEVWETTNGRTFHVIGHLPQAVRYPAVIAVGSSVYVFGGLISGGEYDGLFTNDVQRVDVRTGRSTIVAHLPSPVAHAMAMMLNGHVLVVGGSTPAGTSRAIRWFVPATGHVAVIGELPEPLTDAAVATVGNTGYLLGGLSSAVVSSIISVRVSG